MAAPRQMTAETLNALKGWPAPHAVDFHAEIDDTVLGNGRVPAGTVVHVASDGEFELGVGNDPLMPLFLFNASDDPDVVNEAGDPATEVGVFVPINPTGQAMALVAAGAYELTSTHAVDLDVTGYYLPNDHLTALKGTDIASDHGKLDKGILNTNTICGVVSRGIVDNGYGHDAVAFWPVYIPVMP